MLLVMLGHFVVRSYSTEKWSNFSTLYSVPKFPCQMKACLKNSKNVVFLLRKYLGGALA